MDRDPEAGSSPPPPPNPVRSSSPPSGCRSRSGSGSRSPSHTPSPSSGSRSPSSSRLDARPDRRLDYRPKRSSATCATCRTRKVRCNGARPLCSNCQRLGFPCSYGDDAAAAADAARPDSCHAVPRRRVKRACLTCHARKARCSGHLPACDRCRAQGLECVYRPGKRTARASARPAGPDVRSPRSHASAADDGCLDSDAALPDRDDLTTCLDESFEALIGRTFDHFFRHVHHIPMYSFLHRASLMAQHAAGKVDRSLLLALVGITSCLTDMGPAVREYGDRCVDEAEALVLADYTRPSTFKLQALVFIVKHRILSNKFASAFFLFSIASRFAVALRLNHDNPALCFLAQESRRRLMWALYCIDSGIANGHRDCALWRADRIHVRLPCNERNFEFDLPQPADRLVAGPDEPPPPPRHAEDVGSLALHVRIFHIRQRIVDFVRDALVSPDLGPADLEAALLSFHEELDTFANRLPASFQFSENSLRLRAYSPRICVFVMIHVWWRQCHCDLYRLVLAGSRESLSRSRLEALDGAFLQHCRRQCRDHALAMASIFSAMQRLGVKPVADLDLALCAFQCAHMLRHVHLVDADGLGLGAEDVAAQAEVCLRAVEQCCRGPAAAAVAAELASWISRGIVGQPSPAHLASPGLLRLNGASPARHGASRHPVLRSIEVTDDPDLVSATGTAFAADAASSTNKLASLSLPPAAMPAHPSPSEDGGVPDAQRPRAAGATGRELGNAYEGALDGLGLGGALDFAAGFDAVAATPWAPSCQEWTWPELLQGGGIAGM